MKVERLVAVSLVILCGAASGLHAWPIGKPVIDPKLVEQPGVKNALVGPITPAPTFYGKVTLVPDVDTGVLPDIVNCFHIKISAGHRQWTSWKQGWPPRLEVVTDFVVHASGDYLTRQCSYTLPVSPGSKYFLLEVATDHLTAGCQQSSCYLSGEFNDSYCGPRITSGINTGASREQNFSLEFSCP